MRVRAVNSANTDTGTMSKPSNVIKLCLGLDRGKYTTNSTFTTISGTVLTQNSLTHYNWTGPEFPTYYMRVRAVNSANTNIGTMSKPSNVIELCLGIERGTNNAQMETQYVYLKSKQ